MRLEFRHHTFHRILKGQRFQVITSLASVKETESEREGEREKERKRERDRERKTH